MPLPSHLMGLNSGHPTRGTGSFHIDDDLVLATALVGVGNEYAGFVTTGFRVCVRDFGATRAGGAVAKIPLELCFACFIAFVHLCREAHGQGCFASVGLGGGCDGERTHVRRRR